MEEEKNKRPVMVGLFVFLGLAFLIAGILIVGNIHETFKRKMNVVAMFEDVNGLQKGNNVWFSGVKIGLVSNLRFMANGMVEVDIKIETKAQSYIRQDAMVKVGTDGLIGNKIIVIYGGTSRSPQVEEDDTLGVEKTFSSDDVMNTLQENNKNLLAITTDVKKITGQLAGGTGTVGKFLNDDAVYSNINAAAVSLQGASSKAQQLVNSLATFSNGLNTKGTLANQLVTDTVVFTRIKNSAANLQQVTDTASVLVSNLNSAVNNTQSPVGILLHDKEAGSDLKQTLKNLNTGTKKLDEDLEAAQHNFLLRRYFRKKAKDAPDSTSLGN